MRCGSCKGRGWVRPIRGVGEAECPACGGTGEKVRKSSLGGANSQSISPASSAQKAKVRGRACVVCRQSAGDVTIDPMHVYDRSLGGCDDPLCVVPGCRDCHRRYDDGNLDLLPYLEPHYRAELAHALTHGGLVALHRRVTNDRSVAA